MWAHMDRESGRESGCVGRSLLLAPRICGLCQGAGLVKKGGMGQSLKGLKIALFGKAAQWVFEMKILHAATKTRHNRINKNRYF